MDKKFVIGLTGPSGSGKTTISKYMKTLGAESINADEVNHFILDHHNLLSKRIGDVFGEAFIKAGKIDREKLGNYIFKDPRRMKKLTKITFPMIIEEINKRIEASQKQLIILDAPTLLEASLDTACQEVWVVLSSYNLRLKRLLLRDKRPEKEIIIRLDAQPRDDFYIQKAHKVFYNNEESTALIEQVALYIKDHIEISDAL